MNKVRNRYSPSQACAFIAAIAFCASLLGSSVAEAQSYVGINFQTTDRLNVRTNPGLINNVITTLSSPPVVGTVTSEPQRVGVYYWVKARFGLSTGVIEGYVATDFIRSSDGRVFPTSLAGAGGSMVSGAPTAAPLPLQLNVPVDTTVIVQAGTPVRSLPGNTAPQIEQVQYSVGSIKSEPVVVNGVQWYEVQFAARGADGAPLRGWVGATQMQPIISSQPAPAPTSPTPTPTSPAEEVLPPPPIRNSEVVVFQMVANDVRTGEIGPMVASQGDNRYAVEFYGEEPGDLFDQIEQIERRFGVSIELLEESNFFLTVQRRDRNGQPRYYCDSSIIIRTPEYRDVAADQIPSPFGVYDLEGELDCTPPAGSAFVARIDDKKFSDFDNWERRPDQVYAPYETFGGEGG